METIKLYDENNNEKEFKIINTFGMDDDNYCVLEDVLNGENVILKYIENEEQVEFIGLENEQREVIFEALLENMDSHLSPEELNEIVSKKDPEIGIATVYRTLLIFEELNLVYKLDFDDKRYRYELVDEDEDHHHHHIICTNCGKVDEVKYDLLEDVEKQIKNDYNFDIQNHDLKFYGICSDCQEKIKNEEK